MSGRSHSGDERVVLTLDAGGTNFVFSAMQAGRAVVRSFALPSCADDLARSLANLVTGFRRATAESPRAPSAISFAFPGPADYTNGVIMAPRNLPAYRDVALTAFLEDTFGLPVFINNDGDLFTYGEASAGLLPYVNGLLEEAGSPKRFRNLLGVTLGTGLGGGIVRDGQLLTGDNSVAGEMWLLRQKGELTRNAEEGACIRAVRRTFAELTGGTFAGSPEPKAIAEIADSGGTGSDAAREAFRRMGEMAGDAIGQALTLIDGLVVIGGGIAGAHRLFLPAVVDELNSSYTAPNGEQFRRLIPQAFNLEDPEQMRTFLHGATKELMVPGGSGRKIRFDGLLRTGVGISRLGTSEASAIGAYAFAVSRLSAG